MHNTTISFVAPASLEDAVVDEIVALASRYLQLDTAWFKRRIRDCDRLIVFRDEVTGRVQGTTALRIIDEEHEGTRVRVLYTGAVVLDEAVRGHDLIQRAGVLSTLRYGLATRRRVYWFSECDSFRGYLLTRHFERGWPRRGAEPPPSEGALYAWLCRKVFGASWNPETGVCAGIPERVLTRRSGEVPEGLRQKNPDVAYFVERNPHYLRGEALPVLVPLDLLNCLSLAISMARAHSSHSHGAHAHGAEPADVSRADP